MNKIAAIVGLLAGSCLMIRFSDPPAIVRNIECMLLMGAALGLGFAARNPSMPEWLRSDSVLGVALVYLGVGAAFCPANLLISSTCIGAGIRLFCRRAISAVSVSQPTSTEIVAKGANHEALDRRAGHPDVIRRP